MNFVFNLLFSDYSGGPDRKNGFSIVNTDKVAGHDKIIIIANTEEEKLDWIDNVNGSIGSLV